MRRARSEPAFTLLEVILATTTAAMLAVALYASMSVAMKARRSARDTARPTQEASIVLDTIARDLQSAPRPNGVIVGPMVGTAAGSVGARSDTTNFFTFGDRDASSTAVGDYRQVEFAITSGPTGSALVRRVQHNVLASETPVPTEELLCSGVVSFGLSYFDGQDWMDSWDSTAQGDILPQAVEVSLVLTPTAKGASTPRQLTISRIIPMACAPSAEELAEGGSP